MYNDWIFSVIEPYSDWKFLVRPYNDPKFASTENFWAQPLQQQKMFQLTFYVVTETF
jgi:hypothetical protein